MPPPTIVDTTDEDLRVSELMREIKLLKENKRRKEREAEEETKRLEAEEEEKKRVAAQKERVKERNRNQGEGHAPPVKRAVTHCEFYFLFCVFVGN